MTALIISVIIPVMTFVLTFLLAKDHIFPKPASPPQETDAKEKKKELKAAVSAKKNGKRKINKLLLKLVVTVLIQLAVIVILNVLINKFMFSDEPRIPYSAITIFSILPYAAILTPFLTKKESVRKFTKAAAVLSGVVMILEVAFFNAKSFTKQDTDVKVPLSSLRIEGSCDDTGIDYRIYGDATLYIDDFPKNAKAIILDIKQDKNFKNYNESRPYNCEIGMLDENFPNQYITVQQKKLMSIDQGADFSFNPYKKVNSLKIRFSDLGQNLTLKGIRAVAKIPYVFNSLRYFLLFGICLLIAAIKEFRLYSITYRSNKISHILIAQVMAILCTASAVILFRPEMELQKYDKNNKNTADPYSMTFDAFQHKQVSLDYYAEPALKDVEYIYNWGERSDSGIFYLWDYAYYNGKYYTYFGVAPVVTFYYPIYKITGKIPNVPITIAFFGTLAIFFFCQALLAAVKLLVPKANMILLLLSMPAGVACLGVYYILNYADMYCVPLAAGMTFVFICLWLSFKACYTKCKILRILMLMIGGASLACAVASRPGMALSSAILIPLFLGILMNKKQKLWFRLSQGAAFVLPLLAGGAAIMWYNNARFDSPFDFGAAYQLTVSNVSANNVRLSAFPDMIYQYFLAIPRPRASFPFFEPQAFGTQNFGNYVYIDLSIAVFAFPMIVLGLFLLPYSFRKHKRVNRFGVTTLQNNAFYVVCFAMALFIGWQDFCLGGVIHRYIIDIMPLMTLGTILATLRYHSGKIKSKYLYSITAVCMLLSFAIGWLIEFHHRNGNIMIKNTHFMEDMEDLLIFWR